MNKVLLSNQVIAILVAESIIMLLAMSAFVGALQIYRKWNFESLTSSQYLLEKKSYFTTTVVFFVLIVKFILLPFFASVIDLLSNIVPGAMCGAGVISANSFGMPIFGVKLVVLFLGVCWMIANKIDLNNNYAFVKRKFELFFVIFGLLILEFILQLLYFTNISLETPVMCCSVIYGTSDTGSKIPFHLGQLSFSLVFGIIFTLQQLALWSKNDKLSFVFGALFFYLGYYFILHIVGIYIYELPTHICPFCMLQKEYHYIGYVLWLSLFLGSFFAMAPMLLTLLIHKTSEQSYRIAMAFNLLLVIISAFFVLGYYVKNGVWL